MFSRYFGKAIYAYVDEQDRLILKNMDFVPGYNEYEMLGVINDPALSMSDRAESAINSMLAVGQTILAYSPVDFTGDTRAEMIFIVARPFELKLTNKVYVLEEDK